MTEEKGIVSKEETFDKLEIRLGRVVSVEEEPTAPKKAYKIKMDFGKFGIRTSVGRFTQHSAEEIKDKLVLGYFKFFTPSNWRDYFRCLNSRGSIPQS